MGLAVSKVTGAGRCEIGKVMSGHGQVLWEE